MLFASKTMSSQELTSKYLGIFRAANVKRFFGLHNAFFVFFSILSIRQNNTSICLWTYPKKTNPLLFSGCKCNTISATNKSFFWPFTHNKYQLTGNEADKNTTFFKLTKTPLPCLFFHPNQWSLSYLKGEENQHVLQLTIVASTQGIIFVLWIT